MVSNKKNYTFQQIVVLKGKCIYEQHDIHNIYRFIFDLHQILILTRGINNNAVFRTHKK